MEAIPLVIVAGNTHTEPQLLSVGSALAALVSAESLLFAALSVSVALASESTAGHPLPTKLLTFGVSVAVAVSLIAVGALAAWYRIYAPDLPTHETGVLQAGALLVGIIAPAAFAWWVALSLRGR